MAENLPAEEIGPGQIMDLQKDMARRSANPAG